MTGAGAVTQLTDGVTRIRIFVFFVRAGLEISGMATGAIRLVSRGRPSDLIRVSAVTVGAIQSRPVVAGIARGRVHEVNRNPEIRQMAHAAIFSGQKMPRVGAGRRNAVVARIACTDNIVVIERRGNPRNRRMTVVTLARSLQVLRMFARGRRAIVTTRTRAGHDRAMIEYGGNPGVCRMAVVAVRDGRQMLQVFTGRRHAIMAARTRTRRDSAVIECRGYPGERRMAIVTFTDRR